MADKKLFVELRKTGTKKALDKVPYDTVEYPPKELFKDKEQRIREYRAEVSRKAAIANKRIQRLEKNKLTDTPAYQQYMSLKNGQKFSVKGKTYNEVQSELAKLNKFLEAKTSTVRGANQVLKEMAKNTGIKYKNLKELRAKSAKFFELSSKVEQYLRNVEDIASAIGYQQIWEAVNEYTKEMSAGLDATETDVDDLVEKVSKALADTEKGLPDTSGFSWYLVEE